jgi:hypothetical protein
MSNLRVLAQSTSIYTYQVGSSETIAALPMRHTHTRLGSFRHRLWKNSALAIQSIETFDANVITDRLK